MKSDNCILAKSHSGARQRLKCTYKTNAVTYEHRATWWSIVTTCKTLSARLSGTPLMQTLITAHAVTILRNYGRTTVRNFMKPAIFLPQSVLDSHYSLIENILCMTEASHPNHRQVLSPFV